MVLSDRTIKRLLGEGRIEIDPYEEALLQPSSVDVRVDRFFRVFRNWTYPYIDVKQRAGGADRARRDRGRQAVHPPPGRVRARLDARADPAAGGSRRPARGKELARSARAADPLDRGLHRPGLGRARDARALERRQPPDHDLLRDEDRPDLVRADDGGRRRRRTAPARSAPSTRASRGRHRAATGRISRHEGPRHRRDRLHRPVHRPGARRRGPHGAGARARAREGLRAAEPGVGSGGHDGPGEPAARGRGRGCRRPPRRDADRQARGVRARDGAGHPRSRRGREGRGRQAVRADVGARARTSRRRSSSRTTTRSGRWSRR